MLNPLLLSSYDLTESDSTGSPLGSYNPMQFVLRLRKDIHQALNQIIPGIHGSGSLSNEQHQAFSTYLHETIHWWQYMGSNFGFMSSLRYPSQAHAVWSDLKTIVDRIGCFKSIEEYNQKQRTLARNSDPVINRVLNYWHDLEGAGIVSFDPSDIKYLLESPYYASVGHSAYIMYSTAINCLSSIVDTGLQFLPKASSWSHEFSKLQDERVKWHDPEEENIILSEFGTKAIFEGQARISQLQYLYFSSEGQFSFADFHLQGLLNGIYRVALDHFLMELHEEMPESPDDPLIGLFLLTCDIAINPTDGFPYNIDNFPSFFVSVDPGIRFRILCMLIRTQFPFLKKIIVNYSKEEYVDLCMILSYAMKCWSPHDSAGLISNWANEQSSIISLLNEERHFKFQPENLPVRLFFSKFIRFNQDKFDKPQIFCWPGANLIGLPTNEVPLKNVETIFNRHKALFIEAIDGNVYSAIQDGIGEQQLDETLNDFYAWNSVYSMVRQWIIEPGPFTYDLRWLSKKYSNQEAKDWVCNNFIKSFGHHPDNFTIL